MTVIITSYSGSPSAFLKSEGQFWFRVVRCLPQSQTDQDAATRCGQASDRPPGRNIERHGTSVSIAHDVVTPLV